LRCWHRKWIWLVWQTAGSPPIRVMGRKKYDIWRIFGHSASAFHRNVIPCDHSKCCQATVHFCQTTASNCLCSTPLNSLLEKTLLALGVLWYTSLFSWRLVAVVIIHYRCSQGTNISTCDGWVSFELLTTRWVRGTLLLLLQR
jgi:hypothetical protein